MQIVGTFDPSVQNQKVTYGDNKSVTNNFIGNNGQGTSQITFKGTEDLGGGLKASFLLENDFNTRYDARGNLGAAADGVNGVNLGSAGGEQFLALEGGFGKVQVGAANTPTLTAQASRQPFSTKIGGGFNGVMGTGHVRSNNSLVYSTPVFSGFSAAIATGFKHKATHSAATAQAQTNTGASDTTGLTNADQAGITDIGVNYVNGPLAAGFSSWSTSAVTNVSKKVAQNNLYATYDLGVAKLFAGYHTEKQDKLDGTKNVDAKGYNVAVNVPVFAALSLQANYGKLDDKLTANKDRQITAVGLKYTMSKMTSIYAKYVDEKNDNVTDATKSKAVKTTLVGMQTNF